MSKTEYYKLVARQPTSWLSKVIKADQTPYMRPVHMVIVRLVLRHRGVEA